MARILLVDDDRDIRELSRVLLATLGHDVFSAEGALGALQILQTQVQQKTPIDLLITDANMPQHSGFDLIRTIKRDTRYSGLTIAMLTGRRERKDIELALELGVHDYIVKPLDPMLFVQKVKDLLEKRPPAERIEVDFATAAIGSSAKASLSVELKSISEIGLVLIAPNPFSEGTRVELESDLFARIGIDTPAMKVLSSVEKEGVWETRVNFVGTDEKSLTKIRAWIHAQSSKHGRKAA